MERRHGTRPPVRRSAADAVSGAIVPAPPTQAKQPTVRPQPRAVIVHRNGTTALHQAATNGTLSNRYGITAKLRTAQTKAPTHLP